MLEREAKEEEDRIEAEKSEGEGGEKGKGRGHGVVEEKGLRNEAVVRKHAVFIGERKHFEVSQRDAARSGLGQCQVD